VRPCIPLRSPCVPHESYTPRIQSTASPCVHASPCVSVRLHAPPPMQRQGAAPLLCAPKKLTTDLQTTRSDEELRPYFSLPNVLDGLFAVATRLFGVEVVAADGQAQVSNPDVRFFQVSCGSVAGQLWVSCGSVVGQLWLSCWSIVGGRL
jgi:hypothetical protein